MPKHNAEGCITWGWFITQDRGNKIVQCGDPQSHGQTFSLVV